MQPANPLHTDDMPWIPTGGGKAFRPLRFEADGWSELMRLEPGSLVAPHRHTGEVQAYNLAGTRRILTTDEIVGPGDYVYEPAGKTDSWQAVGDEPCVVHIKVVGAVEYLDESGAVVDTADSATQRAAYLAWCEETGTEPAASILSGQPARP
jgi:2,4'-dihydroxyacetophenone dioxygenase